MKKLLAILPVMLLTALLFGACYDDEGNYDYLSDEEVGTIEFDTTGMENPLVLQTTMSYGQYIEFDIGVSYKYLERLRYRWFYLTLTNHTYQAVQQGNSLVYPPADTICWQRKLEWTCDLDPGSYRFYLMAEDTVTGLKAYYQAEEQSVSVASSGSQSGLYLLTERDGQTDLEVYCAPLQLIYGDSCYYSYYSNLMGEYIPGKPKFIRGTHTGSTSRNGFLVATDENLYRIALDGLTTMNDWGTMFYNAPDNFDPQDAFYTNYCDFLVNDGKLHVLYTNKTNDRKFSDPISGDYEAYPFLMKNTYSSYSAVDGAINAWQVIYDEQNRMFRPYYSQGTSLSYFTTTVSDAVVDANNVPGDIKAIFQGGGNYTCVVTEIDGVYYLYRYCFYNVADNGDFSAAGSRSIIDLSGCTDIANAAIYASNTSGYAFYYATDKTLYSFSASSGGTTSNTVYSCESGETITCVYMAGSLGGGWPTSSCILYVGVWNSQSNEGKLVMYEMDVDYGVPQMLYGPMFGGPDENPVVTTGWGKIVDMCCLDAE